MSFDWQSFLDQQGIYYATSGPNVSRGNVAIKCPYCGNDDPSEHLVIRLNGNGWWCWRNKQHRGHTAEHLISQLLHVSLDTARRMTGNDTFVPEDLLSRVQMSISPEPANDDRELVLPDEFRPLSKRHSCRPFLAYLEARGFDDLTRLRPYDLHYATRGRWGYRVIFPVYHGQRLVSWTGRAIAKWTELRYLALNRDEGIGPINDYLLWYDELLYSNAHTLYLCEGPFDALKIDYHMRRHGVRATCFFTSSPSENQISLLHKLLPRFKHRFLLLDARTEATALHLTSELSSLRVGSKQLPPGIKDPGLLDPGRRSSHRAFLLAHCANIN